MRTDPAPSVPTARVPMPTASAATPPPEEPPEVRPIFQGLWVAPNSAESVTPFQPYSGEVVLPSSTVPASRRRCATGASIVPRAVGVGGETAHARGQALGHHHVLDGDRHAVEIG